MAAKIKIWLYVKFIVSSFIYDLLFRLDADKTKDVIESAHFHFTDIDEHLVLKVRCNKKVFIAHPLEFQLYFNANHIN